MNIALYSPLSSFANKHQLWKYQAKKVMIKNIKLSMLQMVYMVFNPSFIKHFFQRFSLRGGEIRPPLFLVQIVL